MVARVPRVPQIDVRYVDHNGATVEQTLRGFPARVFLHEFDHLDGRVYLDRVIDSKHIIMESEFDKYCAEHKIKDTSTA